MNSRDEFNLNMNKTNELEESNNETSLRLIKGQKNRQNIAKLLSETELDPKCFDILNVELTKDYDKLPIKIQLKLLELSKLPEDTLTDFLHVVLRNKISQRALKIKDDDNKVLDEANVIESKSQNKTQGINRDRILSSQLYREVIFKSPIKKYYTTGELTTNIENNVQKLIDDWWELNKDDERNPLHIDEDSPSINKELEDVKTSYRSHLSDLGFNNTYIKEFVDKYFNNYDLTTLAEVGIILGAIQTTIENDMKLKMLVKLPDRIAQKAYKNEYYDESSLYESVEYADITIPQSRLIIDNVNIFDKNMLEKMIEELVDSSESYNIEDTMNFLIKYKGKDINKINLNERMIAVRDDICFTYMMNDSEKRKVSEYGEKINFKIGKLNKYMSQTIERLRELLLKLE